MNQTLAKKIFASLVLILLAGGFFMLPKPALAGCCQFPPAGTPMSQIPCTNDDQCIVPAGGSSVNGTCVQTATCTGGTGTAPDGGTGGTPGTGSLTNPIGICGGKTGMQCTQIIIGNVIKGALGIVGSIALLMMTWGGFLWLTSMGNSDRVEKGKNTLIWATLGLVLIFGAYALTSYIIEKLLLGN